MSGVVFRRIDYDRVLERLRQYVQTELAARPEVREVTLIGSLAKGNWSASSDADIVVIVDRADDRPAFRNARYAPRRAVGVDVDLFVYSPDETVAWGPRFREEIQQGILLYRRPAA